MAISFKDLNHYEGSDEDEMSGLVWETAKLGRLFNKEPAYEGAVINFWEFIGDNDVPRDVMVSLFNSFMYSIHNGDALKKLQNMPAFTSLLSHLAGSLSTTHGT